MKLLVTGGAGFIGSNFIYYWLENNPNDEIVNLDALTYAGNLSNLKEIDGHKNYKFVWGDICDRSLVDSIIGGIDMIVNFAAESHVDRSILNSSDFIKTNVEGTMVLLDAALKNNIRFHHVSTDEVYGHLGLDDDPFSEDTPYRPRSPYSASKASSDHLVRSYYHTHNLPITISNCSNNYGSYQFPEKLIPLFVTSLIDNKKIPLYGDGLNVRDWLHVRDHCIAIELICKSGKIGETYCVGGDAEKTNLEITNIILDEMGVGDDMIEYVDDRKGHDKRYAIDFSKIKNNLGWTPSIKFEDGIKNTIKWYVDNEWWWRDIQSGRYKKDNVL